MRRAPNRGAAAILAGLALAAEGCSPRPAPAPPELAALAAPSMPRIVVDRDDIVVRESCRLVLRGAVADANGDGVIHVQGDGIVLDLDGGVLAGCDADTPPHERAGVGIRATGRGVVLRNGAVRGYRVGVALTAADEALVEDLDLSDNFAQRLRSTPLAEDASDWLWPHANDGGEWVRQYGAALAVDRSHGVVIRRVRAWRGQNGIILDRVEDSQVYDCDCSFLSGWGVALWRSSGNTICRNALDFCVRGYSHGAYNRGQDSAGILCFEQSSDNVFALNSATHGGDGFFGFAGKEALGEAPSPRAFATEEERLAWHHARGCNRNVLWGNDFSHAVAHGIEMTFGFDNAFVANRCAGAAICGVWAGYSQRTIVAANTFARCGDGAYGHERGGINIEHGRANAIVGNRFEGNAVGVRLWWDEDAGLARSPWVAANGAACVDNEVVGNRFVGDAVAVELSAAGRTLLALNTYEDCPVELRADVPSEAAVERATPSAPASTRPWDALQPPDLPGEAVAALVGEERMRAVMDRVRALPGSTNPVGARAALGGREAILVGPAGPYDWSGPREVFDQAVARMLADLPEGVEAAGPWTVRAFSTTADPRTDLAAFRAAAEGAPEGQVRALNLPFGARGPSDLVLQGRPALGPAIAAARLPADGFGIVATRTLLVPPGCWRVRVTSDDGVRVRLNGAVLLEDWTWHAPREAVETFALDTTAEATLEVEYFELDGHAVLRVELERCPAK
jgi:hypothetical protein